MWQQDIYIIPPEGKAHAALFPSLDRGQNLMASGAFLTYRIGG